MQSSRSSSTLPRKRSLHSLSSCFIPYKPNDIIYKHDIHHFVRSIPRSCYVYLWCTRGIDMAYPDSMVYQNYNSKTYEISYKACRKAQFQMELEDQVLTVSCGNH